MASRIAFDAFLRAYNDPASTRSVAFTTQQSIYDYRWSYYNNSVFEDLATWTLYKSNYRLYRFTRSLYNPASRLVNFYSGAVYPGRLSVEKGQKSAIPLNEKTDDKLRLAIGQLWQWSNWQENKGVYVRYGAALGDTLLEVIDDPIRANVTLQNCWPGHVADIELDPTGNVKMYVLEYDAYDDNDRVYKFRKTVDGDNFTVEHDNMVVERYANPYGFVPACWVRHRNEGNDHGAPAMRHVSKWDELNSLATHAHDQLHKLMAAPVIVAGTGSIESLDNKPKLGASQDNRQAQESLGVLKGPPDTTLQSITLPTQEPLAYMEKLLTEIEHDHPELTFYSQLREMTQVTGPAAMALMGDVGALLGDAQATYDQQLIKALQMGIAIAGWRLEQRDWQNPNKQQQAFAGFNLDSYKAGNIDFEIDERELIPQTEQEKLMLEQTKVGLEKSKQDIVLAKQQAQQAVVPSAIASRLKMAGAR